MLYHMKMVFGVDASMEDLNQFTEFMDSGRLITKDAFHITVEQTVPFVPTQEILHKYEDAIRTKWCPDKVRIEDVRFLHYELFEQIQEGDDCHGQEKEKETERPKASRLEDT